MGSRAEVIEAPPPLRINPDEAGRGRTRPSDDVATMKRFSADAFGLRTAPEACAVWYAHCSRLFKQGRGEVLIESPTSTSRAIT